MMPHADKLIERAQKGEKLTTKERRHCIAYLMATQPETTNVTMGELFLVTEGMIRADKKAIREDKAKLIKEDDIGLVIADVALNFDRQVRDLEASKKKCKVGTPTYLAHCKAIFQLETEKIKILQDLGYYPKNLGNMTVDKFEYKAVVSKDGAVDTRPTDLRFADNGDIIDAEFEDKQPGALPEAPKALPAPEEASDAEVEKPVPSILPSDQLPVGGDDSN